MIIVYVIMNQMIVMIKETINDKIKVSKNKLNDIDGKINENNNKLNQVADTQFFTF